MDNMDNLVFVGDWVQDRILGKGSFGIVVLWKHQKTQERLAIKTCRWADQLTEKHKERWTKEVEMMQNCRNPNIVGTKLLPPEFQEGLKAVNPSKLPILCMEYCAGGNLRQYLSLPESCNGLREIQVRQILGDMRNALQFLHSNKITHRDVKPENIVIHILDNTANIDNGMQGKKKVIYKLIDLGYAKEIDSNSVCASFVGTLQYLAPEIFYSKTYSNSVDFWSFGLLAFEVICGTRPFLPYMAPVQWMPHVKAKSHDHICVYETFHGDIQNSDEIFPENYISKPLKLLLESWLKIALEWDPKLRGRDAPTKVTFNIPTEEKEASSKIVIFSLLESILAKKILKVFSVATLSSYAYEINETTTTTDLKKWIESDTCIPVEEQILITQNNYGIIDDDDVVSKYWDENNGHMVFLYNKEYLIKDNTDVKVPVIVHRCLKSSVLPVELAHNYKNCQILYKNGFYFIMSQMEIYDSLIKGLFVRAESLKNESKELLLRHNFIDKNIGKLLVKEETIKKFSNLGKEHVLHLKEKDVGTNLLGGFEKLFKEVDDLTSNIEKLQNAWSQLTVRLESAARRRIEGLSTDLNTFITKFNYQALFTKAQTVYVMYKRIENHNDGKGKEKVNDIIVIIKECLKLRNKILSEMRHQPFYLKIMDLSIELSKISEIITNASTFAEKISSDSNKIVDKLSNCTWSTISLLINDAHNLVDLPYSVVSIQKSNFKIGEPVSLHNSKNIQSSNTRTHEDENLKSLIEESLKLRQNHVQLTEKIKHSKKELLKNSSLDFSFLNEL